MRHRLLTSLLCLAAFSACAGQNTAEQVKQDIEQAGSWIYDDVPAGFAEASKSGKPLLFVFR